jgi:hypothetical protein
MMSGRGRQPSFDKQPRTHQEATVELLIGLLWQAIPFPLAQSSVENVEQLPRLSCEAPRHRYLVLSRNVFRPIGQKTAEVFP